MDKIKVFIIPTEQGLRFIYIHYGWMRKAEINKISELVDFEKELDNKQKDLEFV
jgi:hypothetical protein